jgi:5-methylcytosine-specific restriction endonuclease McrA
MAKETEAFEEGTKICSKCGKTRPLANFYNDAKRKDGKYPQCKDCVHQTYLDHKEERVARADRWKQDHSERVKQNLQRYYQEHKEKLKARAAENHAANREERLIKMQEYAQAHNDEARRRGREWRAANREYSNEYKRKRLESDPEKRRKDNESKRKWSHSNPAAVRKGNLRRAARLRLAYTRAFTLPEWEELLERLKHCCACCGIHESATPEGYLEKDHIIPLAILDNVPYGPLVKELAELNTIDNIQPLCRRCNMKKGTKIIDYRPPALKRRDDEQQPRLF